MEKWRNVAKAAKEILPLLPVGTVVCLFDTETTGLPSKTKPVKIIQFSAIRARVVQGLQLEKLDFLDLLINPEEPLSPKIVRLTGITDEMLSYAQPERALAPIILHYLNDADVWAAYNKRFDLDRVAEMAERTATPHIEKPCLDVLEFSRDWLKTGEDVLDHKLGTTYSFLYPDKALNFHHALDDVQATMLIMNALLPKYRDALKAPSVPKKMPKVERAYGWVNPHNHCQQRIRVCLTVGNDGDIFYDCIDKCWSHKSTSSAKKLFDSIDIEELERQVLQKQCNRFADYTSIEALARDRMAFLRKNRR